MPNDALLSDLEDGAVGKRQSRRFSLMADGFAVCRAVHQAKLLTKDEARRIAANFAKLGLAQRKWRAPNITLVIMAFGATRSISIGVC
jgi:hypothetical protein